MGKRTIPGKMFSPPGRIALRLPNPGPACGRWIMNVRVSYLVTAFALLPTSACSLAGLGVVTGSGTPLTMQYEEKGFTAVEVHGAFQVDITRAKNFDVSVTGDDNLLEFVRVTERGGTLTIDFEPGKIVRTRSELKASIAMPELEAVTLHGACTGAVEGFRGGKAFRAELQGASKLGGEIEADKIDVVAAGASSVTLRGNAAEGSLEASGASGLHLDDFFVTRAVVQLSGASSGTVHVGEALDYDVSGASHLYYHGRPTLGKQESSGASRAVAK
jgi:hypothetical protein